MTQVRLYPDFWYPIAALLSALRKLLRATPPEAFASIALEARAQLAAVAALVRRYIHILAADLAMPPPGPLPPLPDDPEERSRGGARVYRLPLIERPCARSCASHGDDPPDLQWALLMEAADRLAEVLSNPAPHGLRLARFLRRHAGQALHYLPVPWHIIRRVGPFIDTLLIRLDAAARPEAWAGIDTS
jgi:hypothetical protein